MDGYLVMRSLGALALVLGTCAGALWFVRRFRIALPGLPMAREGGRLALVERISIDGRNTIVLVRRDDREHLIALTPEGTTVIEQGIPAQIPPAACPAPAFTGAAQPVPIGLPQVVQAFAQARRKLAERWPELRSAALAHWNSLRDRVRAKFARKTAAAEVA